MLVSRRPVLRALLVAAVLAAPALPGIALGPTVTVEAALREVGAVARLAPADGTHHLTTALGAGDRLLGVTWRTGEPEVAVRWRTATGWTGWSHAHGTTATPEPAERVQAVAGTEPLWRPTGATAGQLRLRAEGRAVTGVRVLAVGDVVRRTWSVRAPTAQARAATPRSVLGPVGTRRDWGADESWRRCGPDYAGSVRAVIVHHTVQANDYERHDVPALIRADYAYHVRARGWCDLGYNMLVDRFGRVWEGRYGGIGRPVVGAHAEGFNTGTLGVAFLGTASRNSPPAAARAGFARVAAFAAARWEFDPRKSTDLTSGGSPRYAAGRTVRLPRVMGHRDTGRTDCPGGELYAGLRRIREEAHRLATGGTQLRFVETTVEGAPVHAPAPVTITVRTNQKARWSLTVRTRSGSELTRARGHSKRATLSWDGLVDTAGIGLRTPVPPQHVTWTVRAWHPGHKDDARRRTGTLRVGLPYVSLG